MQNEEKRSSTNVGTSEGRMTTSDKRDAAANVLVNELVFCLPQTETSFEATARKYCVHDDDVSPIANIATHSKDDFVQALKCRAFEMESWFYEIAIEAVHEKEDALTADEEVK